MDDRTAKLLAPIKKNCKQIVSKDQIDVYIQDLIKQITTNDQIFYQYHTFLLLLEILNENRDLNPIKVHHIFKLLDLILNSNSNKKSKRTIAIVFYNFFYGLNEVCYCIFI